MKIPISVLSIAILSLLTGAAEPPATQPAHPQTAAQKAFARFQSLSGNYTGKSTKGWEESILYRTIAGGSAVIELSTNAHPAQTMATMIHLDTPERLLLTHYCMAKNQPRLLATRISDDASEITFTFLDATGIASRDQGHMDEVTFHFNPDNTFTSQWTWYQAGKARWMELITHTPASSAIDWQLLPTTQPTNRN